MQALHTIYGTLVSSSPQNATLYTQWGTILSHINRSEEAGAQFYQAGIIHHNRGEYALAKSEFSYAISLLKHDENSGNSTSLLCRVQLWLGAVYKQLNDTNSALEHMQKVAVPECPELEQDALAALLSMFLIANAEGTLTHYQRLSFADTLAKLNHISHAAKQYLEAGIGLRAIDLRNNVKHILHAFSSALQLSAQVETLETFHAEVLYWTAVVKWEIGETNEAIKLLQEAATTTDPRVRKLATDNLKALGNI